MAVSYPYAQHGVSMPPASATSQPWGPYQVNATSGNVQSDPQASHVLAPTQPQLSRAYSLGVTIGGVVESVGFAPPSCY